MDLNQIRYLLLDDDIDAVDVTLTTKEVIRVEEIDNKSTADVLIVKKPKTALIGLKHVAVVKGVKKSKNSVSTIIN